MADLSLSIAINYYDHVSDLLRGRVRAEGVTFTAVDLPVEEIFFRMSSYQEWDVAEFSMAKYVSLAAAGDPPFWAIPVFPSRVFRQSSVYVAERAGITKPQDLAGKRVGIPEWAQTAGIYVRGYLQHQCGVPLQDIRWFQGGVNEAGRVEKVALRLPAGVELTRVPDRSLNAMLLAGELDAIVSAREPPAFASGDPRVKRLLPNAREVEEAYFRETGIFPIMHVLVIRRSIVEQHPWVAMNLFKAFDEAKNNSVQRLMGRATPRVPLPWGPDLASEVKSIFGENWWPYGIDANRVTLNAFLQYSAEQGVTSRLLKAEELFPRQMAASYKV